MRLLVVDDNVQALKLIQTLLESLGYDVLALHDSRAAQKSVDRETFGAAFVDARMPHLDGLALAQHIRGSVANSHIPIAMITGYGDGDTMRAAFKVGITFFLAKPIDRKKLNGLLTAMQQVMMKHRRSCVRLPVQTIVVCKIGESEFKALSIDISESGMLLEGAGRLSPQQNVELTFSLPDIAGSVNAHATVVRREPEGRVALKFGELAAESLKAIEGYISGGLLT